MNRCRIPGTYGPWGYGPLSRATVRHIGRGRPAPVHKPIRPPDSRVFNAARQVALARAKPAAPARQEASMRSRARAFASRVFGRRKV